MRIDKPYRVTWWSELHRTPYQRDFSTGMQAEKFANGLPDHCEDVNHEYITEPDPYGREQV